MATTIRPEVSAKNPYWIEKHRYYELKHFCLQYPFWKRAYASLDGLSKQPDNPVVPGKNTSHGNPTAKCVEAKEFYLERMKMVEQTAIKAGEELSDYILKGVTEGITYDGLRTKYNIPCCKDVYYDRYRKFFYLLSKERQ